MKKVFLIMILLIMVISSMNVVAQSVCTTPISKIYFKQVSGYVYSYMYIEVTNLPDYPIYGITGAESWNNLQFALNLSNGTTKTLISTQTLNSVAVSYIQQRVNNIKLMYNDNKLCQPTCTDSDGGLNYGSYGHAQSSESYIDGRIDCCKTQFSDNMGNVIEHSGPGGGPCVDQGNYLYEGYCNENNIPNTTVYECNCVNGVCVEEQTCTDSDNGKDYTTKGTITANFGHTYLDTFTDKCVQITSGSVSSGSYSSTDKSSCSGISCYLNEYFINTAKGECTGEVSMYNCPGGCSNGVCLELQQKTCTQMLEASTNYFEICNKGGYEGVCFNKYSGEYQGCSNDNGQGCIVSNSNAEKNMFCEIPNNICTDSDGGIDYYLRGVAKAGSSDKEDACTYCTGACVPGQPCKSTCGAVVENYCSNGIVKQQTYNCKNGCEYGECKESDEYSWVNIPEDYYDKSTYVQGEDYIQAKYIGTCKEVCADLDLVAQPTCKGWYDNSIYCRKTMSNDGGLASAGSSCTETGYTSQIGTDYCCCGQESEEIGMDSCLDKGWYWDQETNSCQQQRQACSENDGGNDIYTQGHTYGFRTYSSSSNPERDLRIRTGGKDSCSGPNTLNEHYCYDNYYITSATKTCPNGCLNGACVQKECNTNEGCELYFSSCSCSWVCGKKEVNRMDCARACPENLESPPEITPSCECYNGKCQLLDNCEQENEMCGGIAGLQCCSGLKCQLDGTYPDAAGKCVAENNLCELGLRCDGNYLQKCYLEDGWKNVEYCSLGCDDGKCKGDCGDTICTSDEIYSCSEDCNMYQNVLVLKDVWPYQFKQATYEKESHDNYGDLILYKAIYQQGSHELEVTVLGLDNSDIAKTAFNKEILSEGKYTIEKINGNIVYLVDGRYVWVNNNFIIAVEKEIRNAYPVITTTQTQVVQTNTQITSNVVNDIVQVKETIETAVEKLQKIKARLIEQASEQNYGSEVVKSVIREAQRPQSVIEVYLQKYPSKYIPIIKCGDGVCDYTEIKNCKQDCGVISCPDYMPVSEGVKEKCVESNGVWITGEYVNECPVPPYCVKDDNEEEITEIDKLTIIMKLESLSIKISELRKKASGLADYHRKLGNDNKAEVWAQAAQDFQDLENKITAVQKEVQNSNLENTKTLMQKFVKDIKTNLQQIVETILLGLSEGVM